MPGSNQTSLALESFRSVQKGSASYADRLYCFLTREYHTP